MTAKEKPKIPLPKGWTGIVRSAVLHVISLAQYATAYTRSWAANSPNERMRLKAENDRLEAEVALLKEEIRIKDARLRRLLGSLVSVYPATVLAILLVGGHRTRSLLTSCHGLRRLQQCPFLRRHPVVSRQDHPGFGRITQAPHQ